MPEARASFAPSRKWLVVLNLALTLVGVLALVGMANYLAARHYLWFSWSGADAPLSPRTLQVLRGVTNDVRVVLYFNRKHDLYRMTEAALRSYAEASPRIHVEQIDPDRDPAASQAAKLHFKLREGQDRDLVIFECQGRSKFVRQGELTDLDLNQFLAGRSGEIRRIAFKGEMLFTSAIMTVITPRQPKAYFLTGHGEHPPDSDDGLAGYAKFAGVLRENSVQHDQLSLAGAAEVPGDCSLLIIAGPRHRFLDEELAKLDRYLRQGGRLLALFTSAAAPFELGLERLLAQWGVLVGHNVVLDEKLAININKQDMRIANFSAHPIVKPLLTSGLYLVLPRSVARDANLAKGADGTEIEEIAFSSKGGQVIKDIRADGHWYKRPDDYVGQVPFIVAVERGGVRNVSAGRGSTRLLVAGESLFLANDGIDMAANHEFASHAVNWLLARDELLIPIPPRPMQEYKLTMTQSQLQAVDWILLGGMPGSVLLVGTLVWLRRRR